MALATSSKRTYGTKADICRDGRLICLEAVRMHYRLEGISVGPPLLASLSELLRLNSQEGDDVVQKEGRAWYFLSNRRIEFCYFRTIQRLKSNLSLDAVHVVDGDILRYIYLHHKSHFIWWRPNPRESARHLSAPSATKNRLQHRQGCAWHTGKCQFF